MPKNNRKLKIPDELFHPFFFSEKEISLELNDEHFGTRDIIFFPELLFYNGIEAKKPWTLPESFLPDVIEEWNKVKGEIEEFHRQRQKSGVIEMMTKGIGLFLQYLYWSNGKPVCLEEFLTFGNLSMIPVNIKERAGFIIARPSLYHSFVQLGELMNEQEKIFAKNYIIKKASSRNS